MKLKILILLLLSVMVLSRQESHPRSKTGHYYQEASNKYSPGSGPIKGPTHVERKTYFDEVKESLSGPIAGFLLILLGIPLLWFNERRAVETEKVIRQGAEVCQSVSSDTVKAETDGELVHVSGNVSIPRPLRDEDFGVSVENSVKLIRSVEVYQMREFSKSQTRKDQIGGGSTTTTTYYYEGTWSSSKIDSSRFKDDKFLSVNNSVKFITEAKTFTASEAYVGAFCLNQSQIDRLSGSEPVNLHPSILNSFSHGVLDSIQRLGWFYKNVYVEGNYIYIRKGHNSNPEIGDIRIKFDKVPCESVTIVAQQSGNTFVPYDVKEKNFRMKSDAEKAQMRDEQNKPLKSAFDAIDAVCWTCCCCFKFMDKLVRSTKTIDWIYPSQMSKHEVFQKEINSNTCFTFLLRFAGIAMLNLGIYMLFSPLLALLNIIKLVSDVAGFAVGLVSMFLGTTLGVCIILLSWVSYRPIYLVLIGALIFITWKFIY